MNNNSLYPSVNSYIDQLNIDLIDRNRKKDLDVLVNYINEKLEGDDSIHLNFICTHNSRRSQFSQLWAAIFSDLNGVPASCYSGGVEVTACNDRVINTLKRIGLEVSGENEGEEENPHYLVTYAEESNLVVLYSKLYDDNYSEGTKTCAIMTCAHADENCPIIPGADARIPIRYEDPKAFDDTPKETEMYAERCMQIATEMKYIFSSVKIEE